MLTTKICSLISSVIICRLQEIHIFFRLVSPLLLVGLFDFFYLMDPLKRVSVLVQLPTPEYIFRPYQRCDLFDLRSLLLVHIDQCDLQLLL